MATIAELASRTLWAVRARGTGQQPMPEDISDVLPVIRDKLDDLNERQKNYFGDENDLPSGCMGWLVRIMVIEVAQAFNVPESADDMKFAEQMLLARIEQNVPTFRRLEYF